MSRMLLSIKPEYVEKILAGSKKYEFRKFRCRVDVDTIIIYSTSPIKQVVAEVEMLEVVEGDVAEVWQKTKNMAVSAHRPACCADRHSAGHPGHGGLLRHRRADDLYLLLLPRTEVVVSGRAASRPLLGQCAAAGRSAVSRPYIRHGI